MDENDKKHFFDDIFGDDLFKNEQFKDIPFEDVSDILENIIDSMASVSSGGSEKPKIYGFSITHRPGEEPIVHELGSDDRSDTMNVDACMGISEMDHLVDLIETDDHVHFMAELPFAEKEDINLIADEFSLHISAVQGDWSYDKTFDLPVPVYPKSGKATFNNGVIEVIFERRPLECSCAIKIK